MNQPNYLFEKFLNFVQYVCIDALHPSQQFFSHFGVISCLPALKQYYAADKVSFSRMQQSVPPVSL